MEEEKERLIELLRKYDKRCPECGKLFIGFAVEGSTEDGAYPVYLMSCTYPIPCGRCPSCAENCNLRVIDEEEDNYEDSLEECNYIEECNKYFDEQYQWDQLAYGNPHVEGYIFFNLFNLLEEELESFAAAQEYKEKMNQIHSLEKENKPESLKELMKYLNEQDKRLKLRAIEVLGNRKDNEILNILSELLKSDDQSIKLKVIEVLGKRADSKSFDILTELLNKEDQNIRCKAIEALGERKELQIVEILINLLEDENQKIRFKVVEVLGKKEDPKVLKSLSKLVRDENQDIRMAVVDILGKSNDPEQIRMLVRNLVEKEKKIREKLVEYLSKTNDAKIIQEVFKKASFRNDGIKETSIDILRKNNDPQVTDFLIKMIKSDDYDEWINSFKILSKKRGLNNELPQIRELIFEKLDPSSEDQVKDFASILRWDKSSSFNFLKNRYQNESNEDRHNELQLTILELIEEVGIKEEIRDFVNEFGILDELINIVKNKHFNFNLRNATVKILSKFIEEEKVASVLFDYLKESREEKTIQKFIFDSFKSISMANETILKFLIKSFLKNFNVLSHSIKDKIISIFLEYEESFSNSIRELVSRKKIIEIIFDILSTQNDENLSTLAGSIDEILFPIFHKFPQAIIIPLAMKIEISRNTRSREERDNLDKVIKIFKKNSKIFRHFNYPEILFKLYDYLNRIKGDYSRNDLIKNVEYICRYFG